MKKVRIIAQAAAVIPTAAAAALATTTVPAGATIHPDITQTACTYATRNWVHLATTYHGSRCFGNTGSTNPDYFTREVCPGNNVVYITWRSPRGSYFSRSLLPGQGWQSLGNSRDYISFLKINQWTGNAAC